MLKTFGSSGIKLLDFLYDLCVNWRHEFSGKHSFGVLNHLKVWHPEHMRMCVMSARPVDKPHSRLLTVAYSFCVVEMIAEMWVDDQRMYARLSRMRGIMKHFAYPVPFWEHIAHKFITDAVPVFSLLKVDGLVSADMQKFLKFSANLAKDSEKQNAEICIWRVLEWWGKTKKESVFEEVRWILCSIQS